MSFCVVGTYLSCLRNLPLNCFAAKSTIGSDNEFSCGVSILGRRAGDVVKLASPSRDRYGIIRKVSILHMEDKMNEIEKAVLDKFKALLLERVSLQRLILFGSRARREAGPYSDIDVVVILEDSSKQDDFDYVSDCAWEAGFEYGIVIVPVVFTREDWENSPERYSLLAQAVEAEGVAL